MAVVVARTSAPADLRVRAMRARDLDAVHRIESEVYAQGWSRAVFASELGRRGDRDYLVGTLPDGWFGLRRSVVAYGGLMTVNAGEDGGGPFDEESGRGDGGNGNRTDGAEVHITTLVVAPTHRRRGIAPFLLTALLRRAVERGAVAATLEVRAGNQAARRLYRRFGFAPVGVRRDYYPDGPAGDSEDAIIMWLHDLAVAVAALPGDR
ncbi:MAG: GNAT family N-acetyltransferase [Actinobacteria bacterium]|nr:GNAT family N-acetyltransferase [Actinomycetota bacterium]